MTHDEIVSKVVTLLEMHKDGLRGSLHQEPYKGDIFAIFAEAFNGGHIDSPSQSEYLSADALRDIVASRAPHLFNHDSWDLFYRFWVDWTYAWKNADKLKKR